MLKMKFEEEKSLTRKFVMQIVGHVTFVQRMDFLIVFLLILVMTVHQVILQVIVFQELIMNESVNSMYHGMFRKLLMH